MKRRGIMLISTLMIMVVIAMVVAATLRMAPNSLVSASSYTDTQRAILAIEIGINYARTRFREDMSWMGSPDSGPHTVVRAPDDSLIVMEDHGNVVGLVKFDSGQMGQFRIRFNHQDGDGSGDGLANPSAQFTLDTPLISKNNLLVTSPSSLFEDSNDGEGLKTRDEDVVQPFQAYIAVEGSAGPGLRELSLENPNLLQSNARIVRRMAEARIRANFGDTLDAAAMAAGNIRANLSRTRLATDTREPRPRRLEIEAWYKNDDDSPARIRSKGEIDVTSDSVGTGPNLFSRQGFAQTQNGRLSRTTRTNENLTVQRESESAGFYSMEWERIHHASSDPAAAGTVNLKAGTYVLWETGTPAESKPELHYYDMGKDDYLDHIRSNPDDAGLILDRNFSAARNNYDASAANAIKLVITEHDPEKRPDNHTPRKSLKAQVVVRDDVYVEPTGQTNDFTIMPRRGFIDGPPARRGDPHPGEVDFDYALTPHNIQFQFEPRREGQAVFTSTGEVNINAHVHGSGASITAEEDIRLAGAGYLAGQELKDGGDGLSLYSKSDITVTTYEPKNRVEGRYRNIKLKGVLYAWGDVNLNVGAPPDTRLDPSFFIQNGYLTMSGAMVAYGGNPGDATDPSPGSGSGGVGEGKGNININAHWANLAYDTRYLAAFDKLATPAKMDVISWTLRD